LELTLLNTRLLKVAYLHLASIAFLFVKELDFTIMQNEPNRHRYLSIYMQECGPKGLHADIGSLKGSE
jgi:hypothetical protein